MENLDIIILVVYYIILIGISWYSNYYYSSKVNWFIREQIKPEDQTIGLVYPILAVLFLITGFLGYLIPLISQNLYTNFISKEFYIINILVGSLILLLGIVIIFLSLIQLKNWQLLTGKEESELVKHGIFKIIRHPQDLGTAMAFIGFWLLTNNFFTFAIPIIICFALYQTSITEEERFMFFFSEEWRAYSNETNRWLSYQLFWPK